MEPQQYQDLLQLLQRLLDNQVAAREQADKERDDYKIQFEKAQAEVQSLQAQLTRADALVAAKDEMLDLLRVKFNRPN